MAPRVPIRKSSAVDEIGAGRVENPFAEGAGESLLGAEEDQAGRVDRAALLLPIRRQQGNGAADGGGDDQGIAVDGRKLVARLLRAGGGDAAHGVDHSPELPNALDPRGDIGKALGHGAALLSGDGCRGDGLDIAFKRLAQGLLVRLVQSPGLLDMAHRLRRAAVERIVQAPPER